MFAVLLVCSVLAVHNVYGFSRGAPSCVNAPRHKVPAQKSASPYATSLVQSEDGVWKLTIGSQAGPSYKGILLQANQSGELRPAGNSARLFKSLKRNCKGPTYTHSDRWSKGNAADRTVSEWTFTLAEGATQDPSFTVTIVQKFTTFWTDIQVTA